jgi:predicted nucleic acid-binding protein
VLIDDRKAVNEAKEQGLLPISTRALLQVAERRGVIKDSHALESRLREKRFFLPNY